MNKILLGLFSVIVSISLVSVNASVQNFSTDKSLYHDGDTIYISGKVTYDSSIPSVILQIITPDGNGLAHIANIIPKNDGSFSKSIHAGGPTWTQEGKYMIKVSYGGNLEKTIDFTESPTTDNSAKSTTTKSPATKPVASQSSTSSDSDTSHADEIQLPDDNVDLFIENPKMRILGYPSLDFSPQYYIDRYNDEPEYRSWFDSQFPAKNIYDVLGFSTYIPDWIKTYAKYWATGDLSDSEFMRGLDFMLSNNIIVIPHLDYSEKNSVSEIPFWFRNTAQWWANDLISQQEFINSIKYLIQENIISVD